MVERFAVLIKKFGEYKFGQGAARKGSMEKFNMIVGGIISILFMVAFVGLIIVAVLHFARLTFEKILWKNRLATLAEVASQMNANSWWFSECPKTQFLLQQYADDILRDSFSISLTRNAWREHK